MAQGRTGSFDARSRARSRSPRHELRPGLGPKPNEPRTPEGLDIRELPRQVRAELRGLPTELAEIVGAHLLAAGMLIDEDPQLALAHAQAARRRASRLPIVREAAAEAAYAAGEYAETLNELRTLRRMSAAGEHAAMMADCERALGRPDAALETIKAARRTRLSKPLAVELVLVEAGAREDLGQFAEAQRVLRRALDDYIDAPAASQARLRFAFAELCLRGGDESSARRLLKQATILDPDDESGAGERLCELDGLVLEIYDGEEDEEDEILSVRDKTDNTLTENYEHDTPDSDSPKATSYGSKTNDDLIALDEEHLVKQDAKNIEQKGHALPFNHNEIDEENEFKDDELVGLDFDVEIDESLELDQTEYDLDPDSLLEVEDS